MVKKSALFVVLMVILAPHSSVFAFFDKVGVSASAGSSNHLTFGCKDSDYNFYWHSIGLLGRKNFSPKGYIDFEGDIGYLAWRGKHNSSAASLEGRLMFLVKIYKHLYIGLGGGFGILSERNGHVGLGTDGFYGLITGKLRLAFKTKKREYGFDFIDDHISSPTENGSEGDDGKNVLKGRFYFTF